MLLIIDFAYVRLSWFLFSFCWKLFNMLGHKQQAAIFSATRYIKWGRNFFTAPNGSDEFCTCVRRRSRWTFSTHFEIFRRRVDGVVIYFFNSDFKFFWRRVGIFFLFDPMCEVTRWPVGVDCMSNNPLPLSPVGCLPSQCAQVLLARTNPWYHPSILDMVSLSVLCPPSLQTLWLLTFVRPSSGKCGQRIGVFSVLWSELLFCWLQCASSLLHSWLSVATGCAKFTCNTSFQRQVVCLCQAFSMSMSH